MSVSINKVKIMNFKSIPFAEFDLKHRTAFSGANKKGKSTCVEAIYWVVTGRQLDGHADFQSFKPQQDTRAVVTVEIETSNGHKVRREYSENYTKTKGSGAETLSGHSQSFYIDNNRIATQKEYEAQLDVILEVHKPYRITSPNIDIKQLISNPLYFSSILDMKERRRLLFDIVGDIDNQDIFDRNAQLLLLKDRMTFGSNVETIRKSCQQSIKLNRQEIDDKDLLIRNAEQKFPPEPEELKEAKRQLEALNKDIALAKDPTTGNDVAINAKRAQISDLKAKSANEYQKAYEEYNKAKNDVFSAQNRYREELVAKEREIAELQRQKDQNESDRQKFETQKNYLKQEMFNIKNEIEELKSRPVNADDIKITCEHCGEIANEKTYTETLEARKQKHAEELELLALKGANRRRDYDDYTAKINELPTSDAIDIQINAIKDSIDLIKMQLEKSKSDTTTIEEPIRPYADEISKLEAELAELQSHDGIKISRDRITELEAKRIPYQEILNKQVVFEQAQADIAKLESERQALNNSLTENETVLILCDEFVRIKYELFKKKAKLVFPDIEFQLIQQNIKEGSWNEVCFVLVGDNQVPFENGSTTEQIIAGIKIIENIKNSLDVNDLPIFFDCGEAFTNDTIKTIVTGAQIIVAYPTNEHNDLRVTEWGN